MRFQARFKGGDRVISVKYLVRGSSNTGRPDRLRALDLIVVKLADRAVSWRVCREIRRCEVTKGLESEEQNLKVNTGFDREPMKLI